MTPAFTVRRLGASDAAAYRELRLEALHACPEAFGASWEEEASKPLRWFAERLSGNVVCGGWLGDRTLAGVAGLAVPAAAKLRHKAALWGVFVRPEARGTGLAAALARCAIGQAGPGVEGVRLTVAASNAAAVRLYARLGFEAYGLERRALKVAGRYHDELLMALRLDGSG